MKSCLFTVIAVLYLSSTGLVRAHESNPNSYCSSFLNNLKSKFSEGISQIEQSHHHRAYDSFGDTLMRIRAESKYLNDCAKADREHIEKLRVESARTLTKLRGQM